MSNGPFYEKLETRFFYCWVQLPTVDVRLVFWLAISPIGGQVVAATCEQSWSSLSKPLHEVPREAVSDSKLYPLCCLQSSCWSLFPLLQATSLLPAQAPPEYSFRCWIALKGHREWPNQGALHVGHDDQVICNLVGILPFNFSTRHRSDSNFWTAPWSWTHGDRPACARSRCSQQTDKQIPLITEPLAISWNVSHTIVVGRSTSGSHCVKHMLQACDKFGVMGWRKYIKIVSPTKRHVQWTALPWKNGFEKMCKYLHS